jgi:nucleoside-diphosphate-sugar epimerase
MMGDILNISSIQKSKIIFSRPNDNPIIIGANQLIQQDVDWEPKISLKNSLKDILQYWEERV